MNDDVLTQAAAWLDADQPVAMATIVRIFGSSSQPLGARMVMTVDNQFVGAVSGGCVETDVYEAARTVMRDASARMLYYQQVENPLVEIGLNCDGKIDVLLERLNRDVYDLLTAAGRHTTVTLCTPGQPETPDAVHARVHPDGTATGPGGAPVELPPAVIHDALAALENDPPVTASYPDGRVALFQPVLPPPMLLIFGAEQVAVPLVRLARLMGFRTVVSDARPAYATREKHPDADLVLAAWPDAVVEQVGVDDRTYVVSLNHEPRFEDAMLRALLNSRSARYIGAIGKRSRHAERLQRAAEAGVDLGHLPEIHTPIGLDIGGKSPEEMALSIMAEIVAVKNGRSGGLLSHTRRRAKTSPQAG